MNLLDIKAPTYNEMKVDYEDGKWVLEAVLDV
jgi:SHS2 domain-containing protein